MIGSAYVWAWRVSDTGLLNISGLDAYFSGILSEFGMQLSGAFNQLPVVYGDGIFPQLSSIVTWYALSNPNEARVNRQLASVRQSIKHIFTLHSNIFSLFFIPQRFKLLVHGVECHKMVLNSFFLINCYTCFNKSNNNSNIQPPTIEEYIPLNETIKQAPNVLDRTLGGVYNHCMYIFLYIIHNVFKLDEIN